MASIYFSLNVIETSSWSGNFALSILSIIGQCCPTSPSRFFLQQCSVDHLPLISLFISAVALETENPNAATIKARKRSRFSVTSTHSSFSQTVFLRSNLILTSNPLLGIPSILILKGFLTKMLHEFPASLNHYSLHVTTITKIGTPHKL